ncbi:MAG TPA: cobalt ECF transporter T component CbiQ [Methanomicrobiales archaeon]|nr:cobalt ECF transporter T component CbiQ [Methanomicrobiales archaeon]
MFETLLDDIAQESAFRHIHPGTKLLLGLGSLVICLVSPSPWVPLISGMVLSCTLVIPARVSPVVYGELLLGPAVFTVLSVVLLLFLLGGGAVIWRYSPDPWINLTITEGSLREGILVLCRVFGCSVSLFFITLTTPMTDLFNLMKRARVPVELIDLMMIMYRYVFIFYKHAKEIYLAQKMRLGYGTPKESLRSLSSLCGMLFITSWNAGEDLIRAMDCRCYDGVIPSLGQVEPVRARSIIPVVLYLIFLGGIVFVASARIVMLP